MKKTYLPVWFHVILLLICAAYSIVVFVIGPPSGGLIRWSAYYYAAYTLWMPIIIGTIYTLNCRVTIAQEYIKIKYMSCMKFVPKTIKYDEIEKIEVERVPWKKPRYEYQFFLKNSNKTKCDFSIDTLLFWKRERIEKALSELALMINSKNALENLENKEDQVLPPSETINN